ncbi:GFP-like fluorescent chromoprotein amFP486 [Stylophora pistillata]|uniref:GFP-like fluorescent chromoprotein amFP486 n=1 Tax=Stylophora pistillata TaxID=50429 RepID=UPI000C0490DB|nr:GFP-like fluorescent chromoprotein amFP486 [Stylophora pistillata]
MSHLKQGISEDMAMKYKMEGCVNGHPFTITGVGNGNPYEGKQNANFEVQRGPLPFSFDILSSAFMYGNRCFTKYPANIPDYFKQAFPAGMSYERTFMFEDGAVATASGEIRYRSHFFYENSIYHGLNIFADGPIMKK